MMAGLEFANIKLLWLLLVLIPFIAGYIWKENRIHPELRISNTALFSGAAKGGRVYLRHILFALRTLALAVLIVALARPQTSNTWEDMTTEGIDIVMAIDISGSMLAEDFKPNRLEAAKDVAIEFISGRPNDRIGLTVFSAKAFTQCPLTTDHAVLINFFKDIESGMIEDGTAIGSGLATAVNRLKDSRAVSKVIILLTDGVNNQGQVAPLTAAEIAKRFNISVYTIGVGSEGTAPYPVKTALGTQYQNIPVKIDESTLEEIADITNGKYFRATDKDKLRGIYKEIDSMEKTKIKVRHYQKKEEHFFWFLLAGLVLYSIELILRFTVFRNIP